MSRVGLGKILFALMLVLMLALAACGKGADEDAKGSDATETESGEEASDDGEDAEESQANEDGLYSIDDFAMEVANTDEPIEGGELNFGLVSDTAFEGTLNFNFYSGNPDAEVIQWFDESLLGMDENYQYTQNGAATFETNDEGNEFTFTIRDNVKWHDGEPVTAEDWELSFLVIGHPDYTGVRYGSDFTIIEGMEEYHAGDADDISGVEVVDENTLKVTFKKATPSLVSGGIWPYAMPKHIFQDIAIADMAESDAVRKNPIGMGPYKVDNIVPGESVVYSKFEDYWRGEPKLDKVTLTVINPSTVVQALEKGEVDIVDSFPADQYPDNADMSNVDFLGKVDMAYTYIGFKLGTWDKENKSVSPNPDAKMGNKDLRKAMWLAVDNDAVGNKFYHGLRWNATTLIPPSHPAFHDETNPGVTYDPEAAEALLEEAGYVDVDGDGYREDPNGEELVINFASMSGGDTAEPLANYYIQAWDAVGLKVELLDGRLQEFNTFYDRVGNGGDDDPEVDIYMGAWSVGSDVDPAGLYGNVIYNFPRYESEENSRLLEEGVSEEAFDLEYRQKVYNEWQQLMVEEIPVFPTLYRAVIEPANKRVTGFHNDPALDDTKYFDIGVSSAEPEVAN